MVRIVLDEWCGICTIFPGMKLSSHTRIPIRFGKTLLLVFGGIFLIHCTGENINSPAKTMQPFQVNENFILRTGEVYPVKGIVYVPGFPGYLPWEIEKSTHLPAPVKTRIRSDLEGIRETGANTVRLWGAPRYCYEAIRELGGLAILQTIWIDAMAPDFQNESLKRQTREYIRFVVDRIHSVFQEPPLIGYLVGNELEQSSILSTNRAHPEVSIFSGAYIKTDSSRTATECFLAEMAEYIISYSVEMYNYRPLVSYANDIRTFESLKTPFLDFQSQNAYSYAVPYYRPEQTPGSTSGTLYQGWIETLKTAQSNQPLLISETGLSVSPGSPHTGPPNYGYGGNTEAEQAAGILQNLQDIETAGYPIAGVIVHEFLDSWWKYGRDDSFIHEPGDPEEWFGLVSLHPDGDWFATWPRAAFYTVQSHWTVN